MNAFITPLAGGLLIGCSAVLLLLLLGRIAGIGGVVWRAVCRRRPALAVMACQHDETKLRHIYKNSWTG